MRYNKTALIDCVCDILGAYEGAYDGARAVVDAWERNKARLLDLFPDGGRVETTLTAADTIEDSDLYALVVDTIKKYVLRKHCKKACSKYRTCGYLNDVLYSLECLRKIDEDAARELENTLVWVGRLVDFVGAPSIVTGRLEKSLPDYRPSRQGKFYNEGTRTGSYVQDNIAHLCGLSKSQTTMLVEALSYTKDHFAFAAPARVVLSINPVDILLSSLNTTGWGSCHNLKDGCYKTGPIAYVTDSVTAIAYAYTPEDIGKYGLPRKKWRQMVFIDVERAFAILSKHYPNTAFNYEAAVRRMVAHLLGKAHNIPENEVHWKFSRLDDDHTIRTINEDSEPDEDKYCVATESEYLYVDPSSCGMRLKEIGVKGTIVIGQVEIPCIRCGDLRDDNDHEALLCQSCDSEYVYCEDCGRRIHVDDAYYPSQYSESCYAYCEDCFNEQYALCSLCGKAVDRDDAYYVDGDYYCDDCFHDEYTYCYNCNCIIHSEAVQVSPSDGVELCESCYEELLAACDRCGGVNYTSDMYEDVNGNLLCAGCAAECAGCGAIYCVDDLDDDYCDDCLAKNSEGGVA